LTTLLRYAFPAAATRAARGNVLVGDILRATRAPVCGRRGDIRRTRKYRWRHGAADASVWAGAAISVAALKQQQSSEQDAAAT